MRHCYIISYDISDARRLRGVFKFLRSWGDHLQFSVFRCDLDAKELVTVRSALSELIHHDDDQVLIINVGPERGRATKAIDAIGRAYTHPERHAVVV